MSDTGVGLAAVRGPHGFAFGDVEAAAQREYFGTAQPKRLRSASPPKAEVAGPVMRIDPPGVQPMSRSPPGRLTVTGPVISLRRMAATAVAQAPVPQACVSPAPRSHTIRRM